MKKEEQKSYVLMYAICAAILIIVQAWAIWNEVVGKRPWKDYQRKFYSLLIDNINDDIEEEKKRFDGPDVQKEYQEVAQKLEKAKKEFKMSGNQNEFNKLEEAIRNIRSKELSPLQLQLSDIRNRVLEEEYLYTKDRTEERKVILDKLKEEASEALSIVEKVKARLAEMQERKIALTTQIEKYEEELKPFVAPINKLQERLTLLTRKRPSLQEYQIHIPALNEVDRCKSCHLGIDRDESISDKQPFKKHPGSYIFLKNHPLKDFGCTVCHEGQGGATTSVEKAHGEVEYWLHPMLRGSLAQASCIKCHERTDDLPGAEMVSMGQRLVVERGCVGCHDVEGFPTVKIGPPLTFVGEKVSYKWLKTWLKDPHETYEKARMPNFMLSDEEIENIADFFEGLSRGELETMIAADPDVDEEKYQRGMALYNSSRCVICHPREGRGGAVKYVYAPDHTKIASKISKDWLFRWIKNPQAYHPDTKMPHFRFTDKEAEELVTFMSAEFIDWDAVDEEEEEGEEVVKAVKRDSDPASAEKGRELVKNYGCYGCHEIKGFENESKIGVELTSFGSKSVELLDFGVVKDLERSWLSWTMAKLKDPRQFREGIRMPKFSFTDEDFDALVCLLKSFKERTVPVNYFVKATTVGYEPQGKFGKIVEDLNCLVCHRIKDKGANFAPDLTYEGSRVKREWLEDFLRAPDILRPLFQQMPRFNLSEEEIKIVADYITLVLVDDEVIAREDLGEITSDNVERGKKIYNEKGCQACHQIGIEGGAVGPNLSVAGDRLTPEYIYMHLKDPQKWGSSNVAPNYGLDDEELTYLTKYLSDLRAKKVGFLWKNTN
ncbi:MAG: c-type cytochrome [Planctomycetota bacterium]